MSTLNIALAQINALVGDIEGNTAKVIEWAGRAETELGADLVVFPELTITGYPPEDLLLRPSLELRVARALEALCQSGLSIAMVVGYPKLEEGQLYNKAAVIQDGKIVFEYAKHCLPNYQVFDEKRYFVPGTESGVFEFQGARLGLTVCEDIWDGQPISGLQGAECVLNLNASPFHQQKQLEREALVKRRAKELGAAFIYVNWVGGQDELVFDGGSIAVDSSGELVARSEMFAENLTLVCFDRETSTLTAPQNAPQAIPEELEASYKALVLGVRDYVNKNRFKGVVLGLSGGIDSALTLAIAVDALGKDRVEAVMMPFKYTSDMSKNDAQEEAEILGVTYRSISIEPMYHAFMGQLEEAFANTQVDTTEQNIQARSRGVLLMALSNKLGYLVLTTGNKSEMAVGYATLYGDMAGGLDVLKDVPKTKVFELARYRNTLGYVIPENVITRPPSAELAPDQVDEDSLPPYEILDQILELYIEKDTSYADIVAQGFDSEQVRKVLRLVDINEYKRRQAPVGIRLSERAFGRDRRYPITNGWQLGD